jgi:SAM-dependent methyltransferase
LLVYRANLIPDVRAAVAAWRRIVRDNLGVDLHLAAVQSFGLGDPRSYGFDSAVEFPPHTERFLTDYDAVGGIDSAFRGYLEDYVAVMQHQLSRPLPEYEWFRGVMPSWDNTARRSELAHILVGSSPALYREWLQKLVLQTALRARVDEPLVFINAWNEWAEGTHLEPDDRYGTSWLEATHDALIDGVHDSLTLTRIETTRASVAASLERELPLLVEGASADSKIRANIEEGAPGVLRSRKSTTTVTSDWFSDRELAEVARRYAEFGVSGISYATVRDFIDSWEHLRPLATAQGDLKDVQRPWVLKTILGSVPQGGRLLEIGAGQPYVADLLARTGYDVWVVDPYDGSGNGPREFQEFRAASPDVTFVRDVFGDALPGLAAESFDCIYSISVLEHLDFAALDAVVSGMSRFLTRDGLSIHAVDHVHRGRGAAEHLATLEYLTNHLGLAGLHDALTASDEDVETYYLSAESHNRWRGSQPYDDFPMRVCISVHTVSTRHGLTSR